MLISHDRRLLETLSRSLVWLDGGVTRRIDRGFAHFEAWRDEVEAEAERDLHKLGRQIAREEDWLRYGVTARRKRNVRRLGELGALRQKKRDAGRRRHPLRLARHGGRPVGQAGRRRGARRPRRPTASAAWCGTSTLRVLRGDRLGIVGPNGAGKTTLAEPADRGKTPPDGGKVVVGTNLAGRDARPAARQPRPDWRNAC